MNSFFINKRRSTDAIGARLDNTEHLDVLETTLTLPMIRLVDAGSALMDLLDHLDTLEIMDIQEALKHQEALETIPTLPTIQMVDAGSAPMDLLEHQDLLDNPKLLEVLEIVKLLQAKDSPEGLNNLKEMDDLEVLERPTQSSWTNDD